MLMSVLTYEDFLCIFTLLSYLFLCKELLLTWRCVKTHLSFEWILSLITSTNLYFQMIWQTQTINNSWSVFLQTQWESYTVVTGYFSVLTSFFFFSSTLSNRKRTREFHIYVNFKNILTKQSKAPQPFLGPSHSEYLLYAVNGRIQAV